jgi:hypothetical protein
VTIEDVPVVVVDVASAQTRNLEGKAGIESVVALETSQPSLIQKIDKLFVTDDYLIVVSIGGDKAVGLFDRNGRFLRTIGRRGTGPGEFVDISDVWFDDEREVIYIHDRPKQNMMTFDLAGRLVSTLNNGMWIDSFCKTTDGFWVYVPNNSPDKGYALTLLDDDFKTVKGEFLPQDAFFPTSFKPRFFRDDEGVTYFAYPFSNVIYRLKGGAPEPFLRVDAGDRELPYSDIRSMTSRVGYEQLLGEGKFVGDVGDVVICGDKLFFSLSEMVLMGATQTFRVEHDMRRGATEVYNSSTRSFPAGAGSKYPLTRISLNVPLAAHDGLWVYQVQPFLLDSVDVAVLRKTIPAEISESSNPLLYFVKKL